MVVIDHGQIIADDTAANLKAGLSGDRITVTVEAAAADRGQAIMAVQGQELSRSATSDGVELIGHFEQGTRTLPGLLREFDQAGVPVIAADVQVPTLDDVFLSLTGRSLREEAEVAA